VTIHIARPVYPFREGPFGPVTRVAVPLPCVPTYVDMQVKGAELRGQTYGLWPAAGQPGNSLRRAANHMAAFFPDDSETTGPVHRIGRARNCRVRHDDPAAAWSGTSRARAGSG